MLEILKNLLNKLGRGLATFLSPFIASGKILQRMLTIAAVVALELLITILLGSLISLRYSLFLAQTISNGLATVVDFILNKVSNFIVGAINFVTSVFNRPSMALSAPKFPKFNDATNAVFSILKAALMIPVNFLVKKPAGLFGNFLDRTYPARQRPWYAKRLLNRLAQLCLEVSKNLGRLTIKEYAMPQNNANEAIFAMRFNQAVATNNFPEFLTFVQENYHIKENIRVEENNAGMVGQGVNREYIFEFMVDYPWLPEMQAELCRITGNNDNFWPVGITPYVRTTIEADTRNKPLLCNITRQLPRCPVSIVVDEDGNKNYYDLLPLLFWLSITAQDPESKKFISSLTEIVYEPGRQAEITRLIAQHAPSPATTLFSAVANRVRGAFGYGNEEILPQPVMDPAPVAGQPRNNPY